MEHAVEMVLVLLHTSVIFLHRPRRLPPPDQQTSRMGLSRLHLPLCARVHRDDASPTFILKPLLLHIVLQWVVEGIAAR